MTHGKGDKARIVPIHPELHVALSTVLTYSASVPTGRLVGVSRVSAWQWVKEAAASAEAAGLLPPGRKIGTHTLRHSAARHWLANGVPINRVQLWR